MNVMRWFTDEAYDDPGDLLDLNSRKYALRLRRIIGKLPQGLALLAIDPSHALHDGRFVLLNVDLDHETIVLVINGGNLVVGYAEFTIVLSEARVIPDDLQSLAEAVGAQFRSNAWHRSTLVTEIRDQEVDTAPGQRYQLRLRLFPFYSFSIEFSQIQLTRRPLPERGPARPGRFMVN